MIGKVKENFTATNLNLRSIIKKVGLTDELQTKRNNNTVPKPKELHNSQVIMVSVEKKHLAERLERERTPKSASTAFDHGFFGQFVLSFEKAFSLPYRYREPCYLGLGEHI